MTTQSWNSAPDHQNDAGFRAWGDDFATRLAAVGLVQTADTGQVDWTTVARPGTNTDGGYEIWRFDDALQASAPIFIRLDYGTGAATDRPRIRMTVGIGSDGAGAITGAFLTNEELTSGTGTATGVTQENFFSHVAGFLALVWGHNAANTNTHRACLIMCRSADANGDPDARGIFFSHQRAATTYNTSQGETNGISGSHNFVTGTTYFNPAGASGGQHSPAGVMPGNISATSLDADGNIMAYPLFGAFPHMFPLFGYCTVWNNDVSPLGTFTAAVVSSATRTYLGIGPSGAGAPISATREGWLSLINHAILWE